MPCLQFCAPAFAANPWLSACGVNICVPNILRNPALSACITQHPLLAATAARCEPPSFCMLAVALKDASLRSGLPQTLIPPPPHTHTLAQSMSQTPREQNGRRVACIDAGAGSSEVKGYRQHTEHQYHSAPSCLQHQQLAHSMSPTTLATRCGGACQHRDSANTLYHSPHKQQTGQPGNP
jgi:hypothetical protein